MAKADPVPGRTATPPLLESIAGTLERRYGADYRILIDGSPASALAPHPGGVRTRREGGAWWLAGVLVPSGAGGPEWLGPASGSCAREPAAALLVHFGDGAANPIVRRGARSGFQAGHIPHGPLQQVRRSASTPAVSEILGNWAAGRRLPQPALVRIVGERLVVALPRA